MLELAVVAGDCENLDCVTFFLKRREHDRSARAQYL